MKTFEEAVNIKHLNIDAITGEKISHREIYTRAINVCGGLDIVIPYIPFSLSAIVDALKTDENLNNLDLERWEKASGFQRGRQGSMIHIGGHIWDLYRKAGITSASCSQGVCLLKEAARQWAERDGWKYETKEN